MNEFCIQLKYDCVLINLILIQLFYILKVDNFECIYLKIKNNYHIQKYSC